MNNTIINNDNGDFEVAPASETKYVKTSIGMTSLIGVIGTPPFSHANYFSLSDNNIRIVNFWVENLTEADSQFNLGGKVKVKIYKENGINYGLIVDDRIPKNWSCKKLCFTGSRSPSINIIKDMYNTIGDEDNHIEQYTDPKKYYEKLGHEYIDNGNGNIYVKYNVNKPKKDSKSIFSDYVVEPCDDIESYGMDLADELAKNILDQFKN